MSDLILNTAIGNYVHTAPLKAGTVTSAQFDLQYTEVSPVTSIFRRMVRGLEFDVAEMALSTYLCARAHGKAFTGLPVFLTRAFYHGGIVVRADAGIRSPKDLEGRRVGVRSYTLTPGVWTRGILQTEYDVDLDAITWVLSGDEHVAEFVAPANVVSSPNSDLAAMLTAGEIDAAIGARPDAAAGILPLFADPGPADLAWHQKTGIYPISHMLVVRNELLASDGGLAPELFHVFKTAKTLAFQNRADDADDAELRPLRNIVDGDPLPYGLAGSLQTLESFIDFNVAQGVIPHRVDPEDLFPAATLDLE